MNMTVIDCIMGLNQWERGGRNGGGSTRAALHSLPHLISSHFISKPSCRQGNQHQHHRCTHCTRLHASHPQLRRTAFRARRAYATERHQRPHGSKQQAFLLNHRHPPVSTLRRFLDAVSLCYGILVVGPLVLLSLARTEARGGSPTGRRR